MAILREKNTEYGFTVSYHKIVNVQLNTFTDTVYFEVSSWVDSSTRNNNSSGITTARFQVSVPDYNTNLVSYLYEWLKSTEEFENATDFI